jgi:hypothetical protein
MKNTAKILGVVLTIAILAGLFMVSVPVSAANSWSEVGQPGVTEGTFANVHTIAADGKTIYIYDSANL